MYNMLLKQWFPIVEDIISVTNNWVQIPYTWTIDLLRNRRFTQQSSMFNLKLCRNPFLAFQAMFNVASGNNWNTNLPPDTTHIRGNTYIAHRTFSASWDKINSTWKYNILWFKCQTGNWKRWRLKTKSAPDHLLSINESEFLKPHCCIQQGIFTKSNPERTPQLQTTDPCIHLWTSPCVAVAVSSL